MTAATASKTDLMYEILYNPRFAPLPSPKVKVKTTIVDGKPSYLMKNYANLTYYDLDDLTNLIWNSVDGKRKVPQIVKEVQRQKPHVTERNILSTLLFFAGNNLLVATLEQAPKKRFKVVSAFEMHLAIVKRSNDFLQSLNKKMRPFFNRFLLWAVVAFIVVCTLWFAPQIVSTYGKKANFEIAGSSVVGFFFYSFVTLLPVFAIHEMSHGLALAHYGGQPGEIGTGLFYFSPMFYVETSDAWGLSKSQRIMVFLAGNISTLLIGSALVVAHLTVRIPDPGSLILKMTAFYCFTTSMFNFAPPFETDGYYVLADVLNMPNLRQDAYGYVGSILKRGLRKQTKTRISGLTKRKKRIYVAFALMSVAWIFYVVYQSSILLLYMAQDLTGSLSKIFNAVLSSQALSVSVVGIGVLSTIYFGMQVTGYGLLFSAAVKKATVKPLKVEAINDRNLAVFAYLPPQVPESLSKDLRAKMEKVARKLTPNFEMKQLGRSWIAILRMGGTSLALVQLKEHLGRIESGFSSAYQNLIISNQKTLQESTGIYAPDKAGLTTLFDQIATESADAGNPGARAVVRACEEKQNETLLYLFGSVFGTIWTIEVQPSEAYSMEKGIVPSLLLEDLTLTDLYRDTENFKKRIIYGFDSLAQLATEADLGLMECISKPDKYQVISVFEPIRSRIVFLGRAEEIAKNIDALASLFIAQTWSGYLDDTLSVACFALSSVNRSRLPSVKEIREMSHGELATLSRDLSAFTENEKSVDKCIEESENHIKMNDTTLQELRRILKPSESFEIGLMDAMFHVNVENMQNLPSRIREFRKEWKTVCQRIEKIREHVEKEYAERKPAIAAKKRKILRMYPLVVALSIALLIIGFQPFLAAWLIVFPLIVVISNGVYWLALYRIWKSFRTVTRYSSHAFSANNMFMLAATQAIYGYVTTGETLTPP
jgi:hypothetical protein